MAEQQMNIVCGIFARGGSKGVPGKNIRPLCGKPLIAHAIHTAQRSSFIDRIIVSTDDYAIARIAEDHGAEVPFMRPAELAQDNSPEWLAWRHALQFMIDEGRKPDVFVCLPTTAPLRLVEDVDMCIQAYLAGDADIVITVKNASRHPSFNMVFLDQRNEARLVMPLEKTIARRQDAAPVYDMTTVAYVTSPQYVLQADALFDGKVKASVVPEERAVDIDTELDFQFAAFLMERREKR